MVPFWSPFSVVTQVPLTDFSMSLATPPESGVLAVAKVKSSTWLAVGAQTRNAVASGV